MRKRHVALGGGAVAAALAIGWWIATRPAPAVYEIPRTVRYSVTLTNPTNELQEGTRFWVFAPVAETAFQRVASIESSLPYTLESDQFANQRLHFVADIPPYGSKTVRIDVRLDLASEANQLSPSDLAPFLRPEAKIESEAEPIMQLSQMLIRKTDIETADAIYNWVATNLQYAGYVKNDRGALFALNEGRGDCTEFSYLYTALARSAELPTRPMAGFVTSNDAIFRARDIHNWAEVQLDGKWRVVDAQNQNNRVNEHHHIAMRVLGGADGLSSTHQMIGTHDGPVEIRLN